MTDSPPPPDADDGPGRAWMELTPTQFAHLARLISRAARDLGDQTNVAYRSPPREPGRSRTIRHHEPSRDWTVSVVLRGRNAHAVAADMIDGYCTAAAREAGESTVPHGPGSLFDGLWQAAEPWLLERLAEEGKRGRT